MDPFTAALILSAVVGGASIYSGVKAQDQQRKDRESASILQEQARVRQIGKELGIAQQRTETALTGARVRKVSAVTPQAAAIQASTTSVMGELPSFKQSNPSSSGTF